MPKLLLFDVDGTLVLTGGAGERAMNRAFAGLFGIARGFEGIPMAGRTDPLIVHDALARARIDAGDGRVSRFRERYFSLLAEELEVPGPRKGVMPGVRPLLDLLAARPDSFLALLTGNYAEAARIKLGHFDLWRYFACGAFGDDAAERAQLVEVAIRRSRALGAPEVARCDVIVVGDTLLDVACAKANGVKAVAVATGPCRAAQLRESGADAVFEDLSETSAFLAFIDGDAPVQATGPLLDC
jgi:phosphoglycolate phosphatase